MPATTQAQPKIIGRYHRDDWKRGAIYRFGLKRGLGRAALIDLLMARGGLPRRATATVLADHWISSLPYRDQRAA